MLTYYSQVNYQEAERRHQKNVHRLPPFLSFPSPCSIFLFALYLTWEPVHRLAQVSALNRLKNILPLKTEESLYLAFILPYFNYCNQVRHHCGKRNTAKIEKVNERALGYIFKDKDLLQRIRAPIHGNSKNPRHAISSFIRSSNICFIYLHSLTNNNSISDKAHLTLDQV